MLNRLVMSRSFGSVELFSLHFSVCGLGLTDILHRAMIVGVLLWLLGLRANRVNSLVP